MTIWTSYYGNIKNIPKDYFLVSTSGAISDDIAKAVDSWNQKLSPSKSIYFEYKENQDWKQYVKRFKEERVPKIDWFEMFEKWGEIAQKNNKSLDNIVLLCYEKPEDFCHRQILAEDIEKQFPTKVQEFGSDGIRKDYRIEPLSAVDALF